MTKTAPLKCQVYRRGRALSRVSEVRFRKVKARAGEKDVRLAPGLECAGRH